MLGDNKMIQYSPNSRYTAQKIADKVANGAYFYSQFSVESDNTLLFEKVQKVIEKLTLKYSLNLSARQRTYRLNTKKEPIADLIVQKRFNQNIFDVFFRIMCSPWFSVSFLPVCAPANLRQAQQPLQMFCTVF